MSSPQQQKKKPESSEGAEDKPVVEKADKAVTAKKQQGEGKEKPVKKDDKNANKKDGEGKEKPAQQKKDGEQKKNNNNNNNAAKQNKTKPATGGDAQQPRRKKSEAAPAPAGASEGRGALQFDDNERRKKAVKKQILALKPVAKQVALFGHLPQYDRTSSAGPVTSSQPSHDGLHPEIVRLGLTYGDRSLLGSSARTVGMLTAFKQVIRDYKTPPQKSLALDLDAKLKPLIQYLIDCRPLAIGMGNAIKHLKSQIGHTISMTEDEAKEFLIDEIDRFIQERIIVADQQLTAFTSQKINNGDVILTYAGSHVIELALKKAYDEGKKFKVIVVDSRPKFEGKVLLKRLVQHGIHCTYIMLNAISYILKEVSKVLIGAHALLSNGSVFSRAGTSLIAMMAHHCDHTVPVIVATETFKFAERVQLDSICFNELDDPDYLNITNPNENLRDWKDNPQLKLLNLVYDVTPIEYIDVVITEVGMIPPTSVPVVIREYRKDLPSL